jgi:hypothetical protein
LHLQSIPNSFQVLGSLVVFFGGVGLLGEAYLVTPFSERSYLFFWIGLILCFLSVIAIGGNRKSNSLKRVFALLLLGCALYLPVFLRNPESPIFQDELFHFQSLELMKDLGTSHIPITFFPIAGDYPGLEYVGLATLYTTQLSIDAIVRFLPLGLHLIMPVLAFYAYLALGLESSTAFYASLFYIANVGYFFFFSTFSYGTLGIVLFLFIVLLSLEKNRREKGKAFNITSLLLLSIPSIVIVHHVSSAMAVIFLIILALFSYISKRRSLATNLAIYSIILWFTWLIYRATLSVSYLYGNLEPRIATILNFILREQIRTHQLFLNSPLPTPERIIAYLYPVLFFSLCAVSFWNIVYRKKYLYHHPDLFTGYITLAIFGPLLWFILGPFIISDSAEIVYRISPYLFLGVGFYSALFICEWSQKSGNLRQLILIFVTLVVLSGGIIIGDNQAGRFKSTEINTAGGPEVITADIIHAADWLGNKYGRLNVTVGDLMSSVAFSSFGMQRTDINENWIPFYTDDLATAQKFMNEKKIDYIVVDLRDSQFPPRYRYYFNQQEIYNMGLQNPFLDKAFPLYLLKKFDNIPGLLRIYDNGDIVIYANKPLGQLQFYESPLMSVP